MSSSKWLKAEVLPGLYNRIPIVNKVKIGRGQQNELVLSDLSVSTHHATIWVQGETVWIKDEGSTNGTFINEVAVDQARQIHDQDWINIGYVRLLFIIEADTSPELVVNLNQPVLPDKDILRKHNDILFMLPLEPGNAKTFCNLAEAKLCSVWPSSSTAKDLITGLSRLLETILTETKPEVAPFLQCRLQYTSKSVCFTLASGNGLTTLSLWKSIVPQENAAATIQSREGVRSFLREKGYDTIEYDEKNNMIKLTKTLKAADVARPTGGKSKKYIGIRYFSNMLAGDCFLLDMALTFSEKRLALSSGMRPGLKNDMTKTASGEGLRYIQIVPAFPGCLCVPQSLEVNWYDEPLYLQFALTPLIPQKNKGYGVVQVMEGSKIRHVVDCPFAIQSHHLGLFFFKLAIFLPVLGILGDMFDLPLSPNATVVLLTLGKMTEWLGGLMGCGLLFGSVCLILSCALYWRRRPSASVLYESTQLPD